MKYPRQASFGVDDSQSRFVHQFLRLLVPAAAASLDLLVEVAVLIIRNPASRTPSVLDQKDLSIRFADAAHLLQRLDGIVKRTGG